LPTKTSFSFMGLHLESENIDYPLDRARAVPALHASGRFPVIRLN
jgi:hypothetical protein